MSDDHERIWLEPRTPDDSYGSEGRLWCQDNVWGTGRPIADLVRPDGRAIGGTKAMDAALEANAALIAAAPDLLAAALEFQRYTQDRLNRSFAEGTYDPTDWQRAERDLMAAIAKAEGRE